MEWTDISITVAKRDADTAEAIATMVANGGIYIEDYSDLEQQAWEIAHVDLIEQELLDKPRDVVIVHMYLAPDENPAEVLPLFEERLQNSGINYQLNTTGVEQEDWQNGWKKYYHAMDIGDRLAIVPGWEDHQTDRIKIIMDPGMAFGTGTHETTSLCLETLDSLVKGGERVLDIGTGSGILAIAALKLGAAEAEGVDIDPMCVRTAGENAQRNGVADHFKVLVGDLSDQASGQYNIITANIVAAAILSLAPHVPPLMAPGARFIASGIITEGEFTDYERPVTRAEMARIFAATALGRGMPEINSLERVKSHLPDVKAGDYAADAIYSLYAKGVFTGTDGQLTFRAEGRLTRAEAAAIVSRMARTEQRVNLWGTGTQFRTQTTGLTNGLLPTR